MTVRAMKSYSNSRRNGPTTMTSVEALRTHRNEVLFEIERQYAMKTIDADARRWLIAKAGTIFAELEEANGRRPEAYLREHVYFSTACQHALRDEREDLHDYCSSEVGQSGPKTPGRCKFCESRCQCACHGN